MGVTPVPPTPAPHERARVQPQTPPSPHTPEHAEHPPHSPGSSTHLSPEAHEPPQAGAVSHAYLGALGHSLGAPSETHGPTATSTALPPGGYDTIRANVEQAAQFRGLPYPARLEWFNAQVRAGAPMDYKHAVPQNSPEHVLNENLGNRNYGAVGNALGISQEDLLTMAGRAQVQAGTSFPSMGMPGHLILGGGTGSHGDDPRDQAQIREGFAMSERYLRGQPSELGQRAHPLRGDLQSALSAVGDVVSPTDPDHMARMAELGQQINSANTYRHSLDQALDLTTQLSHLRNGHSENAPPTPAELQQRAAGTSLLGHHRGSRGALDISALTNDLVSQSGGAIHQVFRELHANEQQPVALALGRSLSDEQLNALAGTREGDLALQSIRHPLTRDYVGGQLAIMSEEEIRVTQHINLARSHPESYRSRELSRP